MEMERDTDAPPDSLQVKPSAVCGEHLVWKLLIPLLTSASLAGYFANHGCYAWCDNAWVLKPSEEFSVLYVGIHSESTLFSLLCNGN